nr:E3 SUMO-protein ligase ZBED1-like [Rhipicephalus microplus]
MFSAGVVNGRDQYGFQSIHPLVQACKIKRYASTVSTSNMQRHLVDEHKLQDDSQGASRVTVKNYFQVVPRRNTTSSSRKNLLARDLVLLIARDLLPFNLVNGEGLQDFFIKYGVIKELQELPDRTTLSRSALDDVYRSMHGQVKKTVVQGPRFCAVTYDLWTDSYRRRAYITFTCHLVNQNFELVSLTLSTRHMNERHTGTAIMNEFQRCIEEFGMEEKEVYAVTDAGSNMRRAAALARTEHHLCIGHALHNLVIKDGFGSVPELHSLLINCREIVKTVHYRASELQEIADSELNAMVQLLVSTAETLEHDENDPVLDEGYQNSEHSYNAAPVARGGAVTMKLDTPTRWHSILAMFESLQANKAALRRLLARLGHPFAGIEDWCLIEEVVKFLSQFKCAVELFSQQKSSTFNFLIVIRSELLTSLKDTSGSSDV